MGLIINIVINIILIPYYGYVGSAFAFMLTQGLLFILFLFVSGKYGYKVSLLKLVFKPLIAITVMVIFLVLFNRLNTILLIVLSGIIYFTFLFLLRVMTIKDFQKLLNK
jgi:O-antigen/teichoic acid export membrane protein